MRIAEGKRGAGEEEEGERDLTADDGMNDGQRAESSLLCIDKFAGRTTSCLHGLLVVHL